MTDASTLFAEALSRVKLPPPFDLGSPDDARLEPVRSVCRIVEQCVEGMRAGYVRANGAAAIPDIIGGVVDDPFFQAEVFRSKGRYFIAVNYGSLVLIQDIVHRLFCLPTVFTWIGDPTKEDIGRSFHPPHDDALAYMRLMISDPKPAMPRDAARRHAARLLVPLAVTFLVAHEFRHIVGGHLDWPYDKAGSCRMTEMPDAAAVGSEMKRQALEADADAFAMCHVLRATLSIADSPREQDPPYARGLIETPQQALEVALLCGLIMVGTFFGPSNVDSEGWPARTHPPPALRHGMNLLTADRFLVDLGREEIRARTTTNAEWIQRFSASVLVDVWRQLGAPDRRDELRLAFGAAGRQHMLEISKTLAEIREEVSKFAYPPSPSAI